MTAAPQPGAAVFGTAPLPPASAVRAALIAARLRLARDAAHPLHLVATGRTGSGKTTLGNRLLGTDYFLSHGGQDCTREVNHVQFAGGLRYSDLPGVCSDDRLENFNRAALALPQVPDYPTVDQLAVLTYTAGGAPARRDIPADAFPTVHPAPDLVLYVLAADKQFTRDDRRYLADLLARHPRPVYVLNVFSHSPPTAANLHDVVKGVADTHRRVTGSDPLVVPIDCRTGDGLAELLAAARGVLPTPAGELLYDLVADQERHTPAEFAAAFRRWLTATAAAAATLPAGPPDREHPLHKLASGLWADIADLRAGVGGERHGAGRYRAAVAAAVAERGEKSAGDRREQVFALVRRLRAEVPGRVTGELNAVRGELAAVRDDWRADLTRRGAAAEAAHTAFREADAQLSAASAELERRRVALDEQFARLNAAGREFDVRLLTHQHQMAQLEREMDRHNDRMEDLNDTIRECNAAGGLGAAEAERLNRTGERMGREADRMNRRMRDQNREADRYNRDLAQHREEVHAAEAEQSEFNAKVREYNGRLEAMRGLRNEWQRQRHAGERELAAFEWASGRCVGEFTPADGELKAAVTEFGERLASTGRRAADADPDQLAKLEAALLTAAAALHAHLHQLRRLVARLRTDRVACRALVRATDDHYDTAGDGGHRGSIYRPLAADGAAVILAAAEAAVTGRPAELDRLAERFVGEVGSLPEPPTLDAVSAHLTARPHLLPPEFLLAVGGLVFAAEYRPAD